MRRSLISGSLVSVAVLALGTGVAASDGTWQNPPVTSAFTATVINGTPHDWDAVIKGVAIQIFYDDHTSASVGDPSANIPDGESRTYKANAIKCVAKEHVTLSIDDKTNVPKIYDKWLTKAPMCLDHADHRLAPAGSQTARARKIAQHTYAIE